MYCVKGGISWFVCNEEKADRMLKIIANRMDVGCRIVTNWLQKASSFKGKIRTFAFCYVFAVPWIRSRRFSNRGVGCAKPERGHNVYMIVS